MKILLPVDGSEFTKHMLSHLAAHDELLGAGHDYLVLHAVPPLPPHAARFLDRESLDAYYREQSEHVLSPVRKFVEQQKWNAGFAHRSGEPAETIASFATAEKVDLIVMGTHGHSALGNVLLGSVSNGVLARCKIPVLLIR